MNSLDCFHWSVFTICPRCFHPNNASPEIYDSPEKSVLTVCSFCLHMEMLPASEESSRVPKDGLLASMAFWTKSMPARGGLLQYLQDDAAFSPPDSLVPPHGELDIRLHTMEKWRTTWEERKRLPIKPFFYTTLQLATSLVMPLDRLNTVPEDLGVYCGRTMSSFLYFMVNGSWPGLSKQGDNLPPSPVGREKCLRRDRNSCVLTGWLDPDVCHIMPSNESDMNLELFQLSLPLLGALLGPQVASQVYGLATTMHGATDRAWNMLSLRSGLVKWWKQGLFGIKCIGHDRLPDDLLMAELGDVVKEVSQHPDGEEFPSVRRASGRELESGLVVEVEMEKRLVGKFKLAIDIRWACSLILAFSGLSRAWEQEDCFGNLCADGENTRVYGAGEQTKGSAEEETEEEDSEGESEEADSGAQGSGEEDSEEEDSEKEGTEEEEESEGEEGPEEERSEQPEEQETDESEEDEGEDEDETRVTSPPGKDWKEDDDSDGEDYCMPFSMLKRW
ncbi:hypothetical protein MKX07_004498 [Trichoderma sp. CBMAI-0711]|nr:hypothetical protein MKX07_004498 [Trichoderma sp. CBMAI-0711]